MNYSIIEINVDSGGTFTYDPLFIPDVIFLKTSGSPISADLTLQLSSSLNVGQSFKVFIPLIDDGGYNLDVFGELANTPPPAAALGWVYTFYQDNSSIFHCEKVPLDFTDTTLISGTAIQQGTITLDKLEDITSGNIIVGNSSNVAQQRTISGDITISNTGVVTIANDAVTNAKLADMDSNTVKANITGSPDNPTDVSISTLLTGFAWKLTGNSGTTPGTHFIGTSDSQNLVFKVNANKAGEIDIASNTSLGYLSQNANTSGTDNTSFGHSTLRLNTGGDGNTAVGTETLYNTSGDNNTAIGYQAGYTNSSGSNNTFIGYNATTALATGQNRIAVGYNALADLDYMFALPDDVTKIKWRGITYTLPSVNGAGVLTNDGSGNLSWV